MKKILKKNLIRERRKIRVRAKIFGTSGSPRLSVFRSNKFLYAQLIDDEAQKTLIGGSTRTKDKEKSNKTSQAEKLGKSLSEKALKLGIKKAILDRGSYRYHGRVKALVEGLRTGGMKI